MKILWIFFFWSSQNWTIFRGNFYALKGLFLMSRYRIEGGIFGVAKNFNCFWGCLKFLLFFFFFFLGGGGGGEE